MAPPLRTTTRQRVLAVLAAGATAASSAALLAPSTSTASSHREAPYTLSDPQADNTDIYAFVSPDAPDTVTLAANFQGFQEPAQGPNFYPWDDKARYEIHIDNNGDAKPDLTYRWSFKDVDNRGTAERGAADGTFLLNDGPVTSFDDADAEVQADLHPPGDPLRRGRHRAGADSPWSPNGKAAPPNVGRASTPDYAKLRNEAVTATVCSGQGGKAFAGPSDDPFFLDLRIFDLLYGGDLSETGYDGLSGYNVNTVALQLPKALLVGERRRGRRTRSSASGRPRSRQQNRVLLGNNAAPLTSVNQDSDTVAAVRQLRAGLAPGQPARQRGRRPGQPQGLLQPVHAGHGRQVPAQGAEPRGPGPRSSRSTRSRTPRRSAARPRTATTSSAAFLTGFSKDVFAGRTFGGAGAGVLDADLNSLDLNAVSPSPVPAEYLRLNVNVAPVAPGDRGFSRLGAVGGDLSGFPNGRRLQDDVVDIALQVLEGVLVRPAGATKNAVAGLGDGVNAATGGCRRPSRTSPCRTPARSSARAPTPLEFRQKFTSNGGVVTAQAFGISPAAKGGSAQLDRRHGQRLAQEPRARPAQRCRQRDEDRSRSSRRPGRQLTLLWRIFPPAGVGLGGRLRRSDHHHGPLVHRPSTPSATGAVLRDRPGGVPPPVSRRICPCASPPPSSASRCCSPAARRPTTVLPSRSCPPRPTSPQGTCREAAPDLLELGRTIPRLGDDGTVPATCSRSSPTCRTGSPCSPRPPSPTSPRSSRRWSSGSAGCASAPSATPTNPSWGTTCEASYDEVLGVCTGGA